jgi:hypothetical protein
MVLSIPGLTQTPAPSAAGPHPDFSGFWQITAGSWTIPHTAKLTPAVQAFEQKLATEQAAGRVIVYASRWCIFLGVPFVMGQSPPINIVQSAEELGIFAEMPAVARHIYLDGRHHPDAVVFPPTSNGHSVGQWDGSDLLVDTTNFSTQGHRDIPGGGYRTRHSHLVERFHLLDDGKTMTIAFHWDDPTVYLEPHSYTLTYHRLPASTYAYEYPCDPSDAASYDQTGGVSDEPGDD